MKTTMNNPAQHTSTEEDDTLSALLDGELGEEAGRALLRRLSQNSPEQDRLREYGLIGDVMRGLNHDMPDLTGRVMAALENEPTVLAPMRKPAPRRPYLWLAAATVVAITWGLWNTGPRDEPLAPLAANQSMDGTPSGNVMPYLAAHQDFAQAVVSPSEMHFTKVTLAGAGQ